MRLVLVVLAAVAVAACPGKPAPTDLAPSADGGEVIEGAPQCATDTDCVLAGASCCACPSFAISATDPGALACDGVTCPPPSCTDNVQASCVEGACALTCAPLECDLSCLNGLVVDSNGCLECTCASPGGCAIDADCHEAEADCCGCALGGSDTAVTDVAAHDASLDCPADPLCPGDNVCDPEALVRCIASRCFLLPAADQTAPANRCGRPDLPLCPGSGEVCIINAIPAANAQGIGVCLSP